LAACNSNQHPQAAKEQQKQHRTLPTPTKKKKEEMTTNVYYTGSPKEV
jgi:hypothetical protein